jgi:hypothetical protein
MSIINLDKNGEEIMEGDLVKYEDTVFTLIRTLPEAPTILHLRYNSDTTVYCSANLVESLTL